MLYFAVFVVFYPTQGHTLLLIKHIIFGAIIIATIILLFITLKIFFINYPKVKKISYLLTTLMIALPIAFLTLSYIDYKKENMIEIVDKEMPIMESYEDYERQIKEIDEKIANTKNLSTPKGYDDLAEVLNKQRETTLENLKKMRF